MSLRTGGGLAGGGGSGGGGADGGFDAAGGALLGAGRPLLGCGAAVVDASGATVVVCSDPRDTNSTADATIAAAAIAASAATGFVRYHGGPTRTRRGSMTVGSHVPTAALAGRSAARAVAGMSSSSTSSAELRRRPCNAVTAIGSVIASSGSRGSVSGSEPPGSASSTCEAVSTRDAVPGGMSIDRTKAGVSSASSAARRRTRRSINRLTRPTAPTLTVLQPGPHLENRMRRAGRRHAAWHRFCPNLRDGANCALGAPRIRRGG